MYLILPFILIPMLEIAVFIQVGGLIGVMPTVALVLLTAVMGMTLLRRQGMATLGRARASLERNELPVQEVFDGFCLVMAGALLLTPGFVTDTLGLALFIPAVRRALRRRLFNVLRRRAEMRVFVNGRAVDPDGVNRPASRPSPTIIEADFNEVRPDGDEPPAKPSGESHWGKPDSRFRP
ncbi:MAG TPA: FxsA family protein [Azospirillaceae bacterium]|nr:FxsA family protein [Azospirillaceae bacterium]